MASFDPFAAPGTVFPAGVIDGPANRAYVPTGAMAPEVRRKWRAYRGPVKRPRRLQEAWMTNEIAKQQVSGIVESGAGNPLQGGSKGHYTRRTHGILMNPTTDPFADRGDGTETRDDGAYALTPDAPRPVAAMHRQIQETAQAERSDADPLGGGDRSVAVVARSGNTTYDDPDDFTLVGAKTEARRAAGLKGLGAEVVSKPSGTLTLVVVGLAAFALFMYARKRA